MYYTFVINCERLVTGQNFIFTYISIFGCTVSICGLHTYNFFIQAAFIHLTYIRWIQKCWCIFIDVNNRDMHCCTVIWKHKEITVASWSTYCSKIQMSLLEEASPSNKPTRVGKPFQCNT
jgi:hypothetical protein